MDLNRYGLGRSDNCVALLERVRDCILDDSSCVGDFSIYRGNTPILESDTGGEKCGIREEKKVI